MDIQHNIKHAILLYTPLQETDVSPVVANIETRYYSTLQFPSSGLSFVLSFTAFGLYHISLK